MRRSAPWLRSWIAAHRLSSGGTSAVGDRLRRRAYRRLGWMLENGDRAWVAAWFATDADRVRWGWLANNFERSLADLEAEARAAGRPWPPVVDDDA